jgi:hypothetical protein
VWLYACLTSVAGITAVGEAYADRSSPHFVMVSYIDRNRAFIANYGERYRYGERISTGFVESTVNQVISKRFCKRQQMQWTKRGAHLLLQTRVKTLNQALGAVFQRWYPALQLEEEPLAARPPAF